MGGRWGFARARFHDGRRVDVVWGKTRGEGWSVVQRSIYTDRSLGGTRAIRVENHCYIMSRK